MRGKAVLVPFPFDDLAAAKVRPAVCLTPLAGPHGHVVLAFITSQAYTANEPSDLLLPDTDPHFSGTGLKVTSALRLHRLLTVSWSLVQRQLGEMSPRLMAEAAARFRELFQLKSS